MATEIRCTASKVGLLTYCGWWARAESEWSDERSEEADRGVRFHTAIAAFIRGDASGVFTIADDIRDEYACAVAWVQSMNGAKLLAEVAFAWDPDTDTAELIEAPNRDYSAGAGRLCGTADVVLVTVMAGQPIAVTVWDWKTGNSSESGPQLRALGMMVARAFGVDHATVAALDVGPLGVREMYREDLDAFALAAVAGELAENLAAIATAQPSPGAHCGELFCPAKLTCPVGNEAAAELIEVIPADQLVRPASFKLSDPIKTPEQAAWAVAACSLLKAKIEAIKDAIKAMVPPEGWKLEDGRVLQEGHCKSTAFSKSAALALCKDLGATEEQLQALEVKYDKSTGLRVSGGAAKPRTKRSKAA